MFCYLKKLLLCCACFAGVAHAHFLVFRRVNGQHVAPTMEEFKRAHEILVRYQFPMYVYDANITAEEKGLLDANEVGFLQQKIQHDVAPDLFVQAVSPTLYSLVVFRVFLTARIVREILQMFEQVQPIEDVNSNAEESLWQRPCVAPLLETGPHSPKEWLALLAEAGRDEDSDHVSFILPNVDRFRELVNAMALEHVEDNWFRACLRVRKQLDFVHLRDNFVQRYADLVRLNELLQERGFCCEDDFSDAILTPMQKDVDSGSFAFSTYDEVCAFLVGQWPGYVTRCFQKMRLGAFVLIDAIVNQFLLTRDCSPVRLIRECQALMNVVPSEGVVYWEQGGGLVLRAIELEQRYLPFALIYRGADTHPRIEWQHPLQELHSLSFGKTPLSGIVYDNGANYTGDGRFVEAKGSVPLPYMILRAYGYAMLVNHAQYRREFEHGVNMLFLPPCTVTYDFFGQGMSYHPRRKLLRYPLKYLEGLVEVQTLAGENSVSAAPFYMTPWEDYREYQKHAAPQVPNIIVLKEPAHT